MTLRGAIPSKKSLYRRAIVNGKPSLVIDPTAKQQMNSLQLQAQGLWKYDPVKHPAVKVRFTTSNPAQDRDGMFTTLADLLQSAGVIVNDNIRHFNGTVTLEPAVICNVGDEEVRIEIG
jgi:hypothetical protein